MLFVFSVWFYISRTGQILVPAGTYTIKSGTTLSTLNASQNLSVAEWRYKWYVKLFAPSVNIRAWYYETSDTLSLEQFLIKWLEKTTPTSSEMTLRFLPGWNIFDIDEYLTEKNIIQKWDFIKEATDNFATYQKNFDFLKDVKSLEWFLLPDTYRFYKTATSSDIIKKLLQWFENKIGESYLSLSPKIAYETLILASIIEREERMAKNRPVVAGILSKRVKEGIAMGADATVCYGFKKTFKECTPAFIGSVINNHSNIYNTRKTLGYPPTPISWISESAWNAAKNPENSSYYYYLHDNNGEIHYAKTLAEHNTNVQKYLR